MSTDVHTLSGAYALHALSVAEEAEFESHLADCASCRLETEEFRAVTAALGELEAREVPARLRAAVMRGVDEQRQLPPLVASGAAADASGLAPATGDTEKTEGSTDGKVLRPAAQRWGLTRPDGRPRRWVQGIGAVAASLALVTGAGFVASTMTEDPMTTAASQVFESSDARTVDLAVGDGVLQVATSPGTNRLAVDGRSLPDPGDGRVYQLWLLEDGDARSVTVLDPPATALTLPEPGVEIAVTVEPDGGSQVPTTNPVAQVDPAGI